MKKYKYSFIRRNIDPRRYIGNHFIAKFGTTSNFVTYFAFIGQKRSQTSLSKLNCHCGKGMYSVWIKCDLISKFKCTHFRCNGSRLHNERTQLPRLSALWYLSDSLFHSVLLFRSKIFNRLPLHSECEVLSAIPCEQGCIVLDNPFCLFIT